MNCHVMGIVNVTPDSFSDGGRYFAPEEAVRRARNLVADGADIIDLGGESTRPGAREVPPGEEMPRILPVLRELLRLRPETRVSVDTRHAETARAALAAGAQIINDVSMLRHDPELAGAVAAAGGGLIVSHSRGTPRNMADPGLHDYGSDPVAAVKSELAAAVKLAVGAGVAERRIWIDPGFGFAKSFEQNWEIMRRIGEFAGRFPLFVGVSRKSFIGRLLDRSDPRERLAGTLAAELFLASGGAAVIRTHDVRALRDALRVSRMLGA